MRNVPMQPIQVSQTFVTPAGAGDYAEETLVLGVETNLSTLLVDVAARPAGATLEVDLLRPNGDPEVSGDWLLARDSTTTTGIQPLIDLNGWRGVRLRSKSGGTGGAHTIHVTAT